MSGFSGQFKKFFLKVADAIEAVGKFFNSLISDSQGKPKFGHENYRIFITTVIVVIVAALAIYRITKDDGPKIKSLETYKKKISEDVGVKARKIETSSDKIVTGSIYDSSGDVLNETNFKTSYDDMGGKSASKTADECFNLLEKVKKSEELTLKEEKDVESCLEQNPMNISAEKIESFSKKLDPTVPKEDKDEASDVLSGKPPKEGSSIEVAKKADESIENAMKNLAKAGAEIANATAADIAKAARALNKEERKVVANNISRDPGAKSSAAEEKAFKAAAQKIAEEVEKEMKKRGQAQVDTAGFSDEEGGYDRKSKDIKEAFREAADDVSSAKKEVEEKEEEVQDAQRRAKEAADKMAKGKPLTEEESDDITDAANKSKELAAARERFNQKKAVFEEIRDELKTTLSEMSVIEEEIVTSGFVDSYEVKKKKTAQKAKKKTVVLREIKSISLTEIEDSLYGATTISDEYSRVKPKDGTKYSAAAATVYSEAFSNKVTLSPSARYLGVIGKFEVSSNSTDVQIRAVTVSAIYDAETGRIAVPPRSVLIGEAGSFDEETGKMNLIFKHAIVGNKKVEVNLRVGSADGSMGLSGDIYDTRKNKLLGAWIGSFSNGVLSWFAQAVLADYENTKDPQTAILGAALGGAKEVADQATRMVTNDLQNAPLIFKVPKRTPIILYPN